MIVNDIIAKIVANIVMPSIKFIFVLAILVFVYGLIGLFKSGDEKKRQEGKDHILWGTIGIAIMVSVYGIIRLVANTLGQSNVLGF